MNAESVLHLRNLTGSHVEWGGGGFMVKICEGRGYITVCEAIS